MSGAGREPGGGDAPGVLDRVDLSLELESGKEYRRRLRTAQLRMLFVQRHLQLEGRRALVLFEGRDAGGKGGAIRRLVEKLDPRGVEVHPIGPPGEEEKARVWLHRFVLRLPAPGRIGVFDRSWYGRVLVERVDGLSRPGDVERAYGEIDFFERLMVREGVPVVKLFLHLSAEEQLRRFRDREADPFKRWKIGPADWKARGQWDAYQEAIETMLRRTSSDAAPWHVIAAEHKWYARVAVLETVVDRLAAFFQLPCEELPAGWKLPGD